MAKRRFEILHGTIAKPDTSGDSREWLTVGDVAEWEEADMAQPVALGMAKMLPDAAAAQQQARK